MIKEICKLKEPPELGARYLVPCVVIKEAYLDRDWADWERQRKVAVIPIIDLKHSDRENGQDYEHYHVDFRFVSKKIMKNIKRIDGIPYSVIGGRVNLHEVSDPLISYKVLPCINLHNTGIAGGIQKSKLKHKCIHKGRCPHRGANMATVVPDENGILTCPLHGLQFYAATGNITDECLHKLNLK